MKKVNLLVLWYFIYHDGVEGTATIAALGCESVNGLSSHLTIGREYTMYCSITGSNKPPAVVWTFLHMHSTFFLTVSENNGGSSSSVFSAMFVRSDGSSITASLTFTATASINQVVIACQDTIGAPLVRDECRLQIGNSMSTSTVSTTSTSGSTSTLSITSTTGSTSTVSTTLSTSGSTSTVSTTTTSGSTSTVSTTSTTGSTSTVSTTSTGAESISMASVGLEPTLALTTVATVWSTTSQVISITPFATSTVLPTSGERNNINIIIIISGVAIIIVIIMIAISIGLLLLCICKKLLFFEFKSCDDNSQNPSNTVSHINNSAVYDTILPSVPTQSSDDVKLSNNVAYGQVSSVHNEVAHSPDITTSANAAYGQVSSIHNHSTDITTSANAAYGQVPGIHNHSTDITTSANAAYGQVSGIHNHSTDITTSANAAYGQVSGIHNHSTDITTSANAAYGQVPGGICN